MNAITVKKLDSGRLCDNLSRHAEHNIETGHIPGCIAAVYQGGRELFSSVYGYSNVDTKTPLTRDSVFRLASMTKPVTATAILLLLQNGKLDLDDKVSRYFPKYAGMKIGELDEGGNIRNIHAAQRELTLRDLLTHTGGLGSDELGTVLCDKMPADAKSDIFTAVDYYSEELLLSFDPGTKRSYSPIAAFDVLAAIVSRTADREIGEFFRESIFEPLGMENTFFEPSEEQRTRIVDMHELENGVPHSKQMDAIFGDFPLSYHTGGAGLASTVDDYAKFAEMLCDAGTGRRSTILTTRSLDLMRSFRAVPGDEYAGPDEAFGLGVRVVLREKTLPVGAFGWSGAYGTHFWIDLHNEITAVYMKNSLHDGGAGCGTAIEFETDVMAAAE